MLTSFASNGTWQLGSSSLLKNQRWTMTNEQRSGICRTTVGFLSRDDDLVASAVAGELTVNNDSVSRGYCPFLTSIVGYIKVIGFSRYDIG